ncbi:hypothetical protein PGT21_001237 [Puccinia graminis f. sp. tritici]|uniref:Secreted protein n=1 Tax=Puccinia graminis f. sp. tritici TaxID=56615 RepID=A0A5B0Q1H4_PUCGR|nr:hypothetical protein PGT21_001237 [Puccinia graminis f. sp. tritici]KAA1127922.1 hypothetical protein PGTUg99_012051 [Puccinia graminis f. sp. tritici]
MFPMNSFQKVYIGLAFLPIIIIFHLGQLTLVDGLYRYPEVSCMPHFDSVYGDPIASCWFDSQTKFKCRKTSCKSFDHPDRPFGKLAFSGCVHNEIPKNGVVHPRNYHHYPSGDDKWLPGKFGYVAAFDSSTQLWYNCPYTASKDNSDNYLCTDCWM